MSNRGQTATLDGRHAPLSLWDAEPGTHLCALYSGPAELDQTAAAFVGSGLAAGDRVLYVASDRLEAQVHTALEAHQVPAGPAADRGQLVIRDFATAYGEPGQLDLDQMAADFRTAARQARADGFGALRVAAEMGDFAAAVGSVDRLLDWERLCTPMQHEEGITSVCQYDQSRFGDAAAQIAAEHAGIAPDHVLTPPVQFTATTDPWGLAISGELDLASRPVFLRVLGARLAAQPSLHLDVSGLIYAEAAALGVVYQAAAGLPADGGIVVTGAPYQLRRVIDLAGFDHPQVIID
ncbi:MAG: MEDS domain-containing protein [Actinobacteria bacterium]|nr:MEDS domain-containing protein [Actinomycetota bacterium]